MNDNNEDDNEVMDPDRFVYRFQPAASSLVRYVKMAFLTNLQLISSWMSANLTVGPRIG